MLSMVLIMPEQAAAWLADTAVQLLQLLILRGQRMALHLQILQL